MFWLVLLAACAPESKPATAIVVSVKTDLQIGTELKEISCRVFAVDADPELDAPASEFTIAAEEIARPFVIVQARASELMVSIEGFRERGRAPVVIARTRARFQDGKTLALPVFLARICARARCAITGQTCFGQPSGPTPAGECDTIPEPNSLREITYPGEEAAWTPTPVPVLDASVMPPRPPVYDAGLTRFGDASSSLGRPAP